jgi:hypothetical protein
MKNPTEMLKEIKTVLGIEVKEETVLEETVTLAQMMLENGTVLEAEAFEADNEVFIVTEDEKVALPVGEYALEDGKVLVCEEEGIIKEIKEVSGEETPEEEATMEEEVEAAEEVQFATIEDLNELKAMIAELKDALAKEELSSQEEAEDLNEQLKEELSQPAAAPLKHNPETSEVKTGFKFGQNKSLSTADRVLQRISNLNK